MFYLLGFSRAVKPQTPNPGPCEISIEHVRGGLKFKPVTESKNWCFFYDCCCLFAQSCLSLCDPMDRSLLGSSVHGVPRQECWSELSFASPGDLLDPGFDLSLLCLLHCQADSLPLSHEGSPSFMMPHPKRFLI